MDRVILWRSHDAWPDRVNDVFSLTLSEGLWKFNRGNNKKFIWIFTFSLRLWIVQYSNQ